MGKKPIPYVLGEEKRSRDFDVFLGIFLCLEERKNVERNWAKGKISEKMCLLLGLMGVWGYL